MKYLIKERKLTLTLLHLCEAPSECDRRRICCNVAQCFSAVGGLEMPSTKPKLCWLAAVISSLYPADTVAQQYTVCWRGFHLQAAKRKGNNMGVESLHHILCTLQASWHMLSLYLVILPEGRHKSHVQRTTQRLGANNVAKLIMYFPNSTINTFAFEKFQLS